MKVYSSLILIILNLFSCNVSDENLEVMIQESSLFSYGKEVNKIDHNIIPEASGIVNSFYNPNGIWTHNDSNNKDVLYLISKTTSEILFKIHIQNIISNDWEDITIGDCFMGLNGKCLYVGDIGDNQKERNIKKIYVIEEPKIENYGNDSISTDSFRLISFYMEDGTFNSEAIMYSKEIDGFFILSKDQNIQSIYKIDNLENHSGEIIKAKKIYSFEYINGLITASDISLDDNHCLIKTYEKIYYWDKDSNENWENIFKNKLPVILNYEQESQGEGICWGKNENVYYTLGEYKQGKIPSLIKYDRN